MGKKLHFPGPPFICSFATRGEEDAAGRVLDGQTSMPESVGPMAGLGATEPEEECRPRLAVCERPQKDSWGVQIPTTDVRTFETCLFFGFFFLMFFSADFQLALFSLPLQRHRLSLSDCT